tara:strand:+ start:409 stop:735 length:327 start_codon:yes stop_codon:yes gene_type:complete
MTKQNIIKTLDSNCLYELDSLTLREAAAYLVKRSESYEAQGYADITFHTDTDYESDTCLMINGSRLETDAEANARAEIEARKATASREYDLKVFKATAERLGINIENI